MAICMQQFKVFQCVRASKSFSNDVVYLPDFIWLELLPTLWAKTLLPQDETTCLIPFGLLIYGQPFPLFQIQIPFWVVWVGLRFDLDMGCPKTASTAQISCPGSGPRRQASPDPHSIFRHIDRMFGIVPILFWRPEVTACLAGFPGA